MHTYVLENQPLMKVDIVNKGFRLSIIQDRFLVFSNI